MATRFIGLFKYFFFLVPLSVGFATNVFDESGLETAIATATNGTIIDFTTNIAHTSFFTPLNSDTSFGATNFDYIIDGANTWTLSGSPLGFFSHGTGTTVQNLTFSTTTTGGTGGGGGLGAGGGVFVNAGSTLTLKNVTFSGCNATGGTGTTTAERGGGGFTGDGGTSSGGGGSINNDGGNTNGGGAGFTSNGFSKTGSNGGDGGTPNGGAGGANGTVTPTNPGVGAAGGSGGGGGAGGSGFTEVPQNGADGGIGGDGGGGGSGGDGSTNGTIGANGGDGNTGGPFGGGGSGGGGAFGTSTSGSGGVGGNGGFGGGGGNGGINGGSPTEAVGGNSDFGGGGGRGSTGGTGGFAGGSGTDSGSGGGGALGGAIFVRDGGTLNIEEKITFSGNSVTAGAGTGSPSALGPDIFLMSGGQINIQSLTKNSSVPNPIESNFDDGVGVKNVGGLTLVSGNSAIFTLNGANTYSGTTTVTQGTLYVEGSVITPVTVTGGTFGGEATVKVEGAVPSSGTLTVNGTGNLAPGGSAIFGTFTVEDTLTFSGGGTFFNAEVDSVGNADKIIVAGLATLDGTLEVAANGNFIKGQTSTVLRAGSIANAFTLVSPQTPWGSKIFKIVQTSTEVQLEVLENVLFVHQAIGSGNAQNVVNYFYSFFGIDPVTGRSFDALEGVEPLVGASITSSIDLNSDLAFVVNVLGLLSDKEVNIALNKMHPGMFGSFEWMNAATNSEVISILSRHLMELPCSIRDCCGSKRGNIWASTFGAWNSQDKRGELRGVNSESAGLLVGYDWCFPHFYVGGGLGYTYTNFRWMGAAGDGCVDQGHGALYGSYFNNYMTVELSTIIGGNFYDVKRTIFFSAPFHPTATIDRVAESHHSAFQWTNHLGLTGEFGFVQILANVDHFYVHHQRFREHGARDINLDVRGKITNMLRTELGLSVKGDYTFDGGCFGPYCRLSWVSKTPLSSSTYRSSFRGQRGTFGVSATSKGINQVAPAVGVKVTRNGGFSLLLDTHAELSGHMKTYFADMRFEYTF